jgi:hypothetical protein
MDKTALKAMENGCEFIEHLTRVGSSAWRFGEGLTAPHHKSHMLQNVTQCFRLRYFGMT